MTDAGEVDEAPEDSVVLADPSQELRARALPIDADLPVDAAEGPGIPEWGDVVRWASALSVEVARLPSTIGRARRALTILPEHLESLVQALDRFSTLLDTSLGEVRDEVRDVGGRLDGLQVSIDGLVAQLGTTTEGIDTFIPTLSDAVLRLEQRLEGMDGLLGELGGTVVGTINAVPGLRRVSRRALRPADPGTAEIPPPAEPDGA